MRGFGTAWNNPLCIILISRHSFWICEVLHPTTLADLTAFTTGDEHEPRFPVRLRRPMPPREIPCSKIHGSALLPHSQEGSGIAVDDGFKLFVIKPRQLRSFQHGIKTTKAAQRLVHGGHRKVCSKQQFLPNAILLS